MFPASAKASAYIHIDINDITLIVNNEYLYRSYQTEHLALIYVLLGERIGVVPYGDSLTHYLSICSAIACAYIIGRESILYGMADVLFAVI